MRNTKRAKWIFAISFVALLWLAASTSSYNECQTRHGQSAKEDKTKEPQPVPKRRDVFDDLTLFVRCEGAVIDANETLLGALATIAIAFYTIILADATRGLQRAARQQQRDTRRSLDIAAQSASTARESADTAKEGLLKLQRAFVTHQGMRHLSHINTDGTVWWSLHFNWQNSGASRHKKCNSIFPGILKT